MISASLQVATPATNPKALQYAQAMASLGGFPHKAIHSLALGDISPDKQELQSLETIALS